MSPTVVSAKEARAGETRGEHAVCVDLINSRPNDGRALKEDWIDQHGLMERLPPNHFQPDRDRGDTAIGGCAKARGKPSIQNGDKPDDPHRGSPVSSRRRACTTPAILRRPPGLRFEATSFLCLADRSRRWTTRGGVNLLFERTVYMNPETFANSTAFWDYERWRRSSGWRSTANI